MRANVEGWRAGDKVHRFRGTKADRGIILRVTCDGGADLPVAGQKYTLGVVRAAQARGDFQVLIEPDWRALRVHLGKDLSSDLDRLAAAFHQALT